MHAKTKIFAFRRQRVKDHSFAKSQLNISDFFEICGILIVFKWWWNTWIFFANKKTFRNGPISLRNFINVFNWVRRYFNLSNTQQKSQRCFNVLFRLIRRRNVRQRQINVETTPCISTLEFTTSSNVESMLCISTWC